MASLFAQSAGEQLSELTGAMRTYWKTVADGDRGSDEHQQVSGIEATEIEGGTHGMHVSYGEQIFRLPR